MLIPEKRLRTVFRLSLGCSCEGRRLLSRGVRRELSARLQGVSRPSGEFEAALVERTYRDLWRQILGFQPGVLLFHTMVVTVEKSNYSTDFIYGADKMDPKIDFL